eukprot:scaffold31041_cov56-Attheya_sp.AAC.7
MMNGMVPVPISIPPPAQLTSRSQTTMARLMVTVCCIFLLVCPAAVVQGFSGVPQRALLYPHYHHPNVRRRTKRRQHYFLHDETKQRTPTAISSSLFPWMDETKSDATTQKKGLENNVVDDSVWLGSFEKSDDDALSTGMGNEWTIGALGLTAVATSVLVAKSLGLDIGKSAMFLFLFDTDDEIKIPDPAGAVEMLRNLVSDPQGTLQAVVEHVESMGNAGLVYFAAVYTVAEILAIPAFPLTASAGYLFGVVKGTGVVLASASVAAAVSFLIGRTLLRSYVVEALESYPDFKKIDKAIGTEGFKLMLLLRLSPLFPFALSNYLYGATSVQFWPYFWGTMLGFTPGTIAYVYTGDIGKALTINAATAEPWYVYAGALALLTGFVKIVADVATGIIDNLEDDDDESSSSV